MRERGHRVTEGITPHGLRHAAATAMVKRGAPVDKVRQVLGHSHEATTRIYLHTSNTELASAMALLGERDMEKLNTERIKDAIKSEAVGGIGKFAASQGVHRGTVHNWLKTPGHFPALALGELARMREVSVDYFYQGGS